MRDPVTSGAALLKIVDAGAPLRVFFGTAPPRFSSHPATEVLGWRTPAGALNEHLLISPTGRCCDDQLRQRTLLEAIVHADGKAEASDNPGAGGLPVA